MRVLLQHLGSKQYYRGEELWTANANEALDFQFSGGSLELQEKLKLMDAQLVVAMEPPLSLRSPEQAPQRPEKP